MSAVRGINHVTFAVSDLDRSIDFYQNTLGMSVKKNFGSGAYLEAGNDWICLSLDPNAKSKAETDYTHVAFDVDDMNFDILKSKLCAQRACKWKENKSEGRSFYFLDPDGHKLEIHVGSLQSRLDYMEKVA